MWAAGLSDERDIQRIHYGLRIDDMREGRTIRKQRERDVSALLVLRSSRSILPGRTWNLKENRIFTLEHTLKALFYVAQLQ